MAALAGAHAGAGQAVRPATLLQQYAADRAVMGEGAPMRVMVLQCLKLFDLLQFRATCRHMLDIVARYDCANIAHLVPVVRQQEVLASLHKAVPRLKCLSFDMKRCEYADYCMISGLEDVSLQVTSATQSELRLISSCLSHFAMMGMELHLAASALQQMSRLKSLHIGFCTCTDEHFAFLKGLQHLSLRTVVGVTRDGLQHVAPQLVTLRLDELIDVITLPQMPTLRSLRLDAVPGTDFNALPRLPSLEYLFVNGVEPEQTDRLWSMVADRELDGTWTAQHCFTTAILNDNSIRSVPAGLVQLSLTAGEPLADVELVAATRTLKVFEVDQPLPDGLTLPDLQLLKLSVECTDMDVPRLLAQCPALRALSMPSGTAGAVYTMTSARRESFKRAIAHIPYLFLPLYTNLVGSEKTLELLQYCRTVRVLDVSSSHMCTDAHLAPYAWQLEYLDVSQCPKITLQGLERLRKLKVLHISILSDDAVFRERLLSYILTTPSLVAVLLEVEEWKNNGSAQPRSRTSARSDKAITFKHQFAADLRSRLANLGPDSTPVRVCCAPLGTFLHKLTPFQEWPGERPWLQFDLGEYVVIHRAELEQWAGPSLVDWHARL